MIFIGYTLPHFASCWGQIDCLKVLVQSGAALDKVTMHGESVRDVAVRYKKTNCVEYIDWAGNNTFYTNMVFESSVLKI